jgi:ABC-type uncharacterized transport system ATPase subunit
MIQVQNLTKYYGDFLALDQISFEVTKGEILGFLGPNGAGNNHHHAHPHGLYAALGRRGPRERL